MKNKSVFLMIVAAVMMIAACAGLIKTTVFNDKTYVVTVTDKERIVESAGENTSSKYLVYCEDEKGEVIVFENVDSVFRLKFKSSDYQAKLKEGKKYKITVVGYRIPFMSAYQNIVDIELIND